MATDSVDTPLTWDSPVLLEGLRLRNLDINKAVASASRSTKVMWSLAGFGAVMLSFAMALRLPAPGIVVLAVGFLPAIVVRLVPEFSHRIYSDHGEVLTGKVQAWHFIAAGVRFPIVMAASAILVTAIREHGGWWSIMALPYLHLAVAFSTLRCFGEMREPRFATGDTQPMRPVVKWKGSLLALALGAVAGVDGLAERLGYELGHTVGLTVGYSLVVVVIAVGAVALAVGWVWRQRGPANKYFSTHPVDLAIVIAAVTSLLRRIIRRGGGNKPNP